jgi:hypothetical protein
MNDFINSLDALFRYCETHSMIAIPARVFKFQVENTRGKTPEENLDLMEASLYELKNTLQQLNSGLNYVMEQALESQKQKNIDQFAQSSL